MDRSKQLGRYHRLEQELQAAYTAIPSDSAAIERLTDELAAMQRLLRRTRPGELDPPGTPTVDVLLD